jgi:hypothetical protein
MITVKLFNSLYDAFYGGTDLLMPAKLEQIHLLTK